MTINRKGTVVHTESVEGPWANVEIEIRTFGDGRLDLWLTPTWKPNCGRLAGPGTPMLSIWAWALEGLIGEAREQARSLVPR